MVAFSDKKAIAFSLSAGKAHDAPPGRELLTRLPALLGQPYWVMDRAYEGAPTRSLAEGLGFKPVVPPKKNRKHPWEYDKQIDFFRNRRL